MSEKQFLKDDSFFRDRDIIDRHMPPVKVADRLYCLDCGEPFYIDGDGLIHTWMTNESIMDTDNFVNLKHR